MNYKYIIILSIAIFFVGKSEENELIQDINFQNSTIKIEYKQGNIEFFASNRTSELIKVYNRNRSLNTVNISALEWYSIGRPILITSNLSNTISTNTFFWSPNGFHILIDFLSSNQKKHLVNRIGPIYGIKIDSSQITMIKPSRLECFTEFECDNKTIRINGSAQDLKGYIFKVEFLSAYKSLNRVCLEMHLIENPDIEINCEIEKYLSRTTEGKSFSLTTNEMKTLGITDRLFNGNDSVNITRIQLNMLSDEIYKLFDMENKTNITKDEFSKKFLDDLKTNFNHVEFKEGLRSISRFGIEDLDIEQIINDLENFIKIEFVCNEKNLSNSEFCLRYPVFTLNPDFNSSSAKLFGNLTLSKLSVPIEYLFNRTLIIQLINNHIYEDIKWKYDGKDDISPKVSLNIALLEKENFKRDMIFETERKLVNDSVFKRTFKFSTKSRINCLFFDHINFMSQLIISIKVTQNKPTQKSPIKS